MKLSTMITPRKEMSRLHRFAIQATLSFVAVLILVLVGSGWAFEGVMAFGIIPFVLWMVCFGLLGHFTKGFYDGLLILFLLVFFLILISAIASQLSEHVGFCAPGSLDRDGNCWGTLSGGVLLVLVFIPLAVVLYSAGLVSRPKKDSGGDSA